MTPSATTAVPPAPVLPEPVETEFPHGWREVARTDAKGKVEIERIPLTLEDVLHPREGDYIPHSTQHCDECIYIQHACRTRLHGVAGVLVLNDCLIHWGNVGVRPMSPDVAVIFNVADPTRRRGMFYTVAEGTRPSVVVEVVSPDGRGTDEAKIALYHQVGIRDYVMIDQLREDGPRWLRHFRWQPGGYAELPVSANGVLLAVAHVRIQLRDNRVVCLDDAHGRGNPPSRSGRSRPRAGGTQGASGAREREKAELAREKADRIAQEQTRTAKKRTVPVRKPTASLRSRRRAHEEADRARRDADRIAQEQTLAREEADRARQEADLARRKADRNAQEQTRAREEADLARREADRIAQEQTKAREEADRARQEADRNTQEQTRAREEAERRMRKLEEELRRLRGEPPA